MLVTSASGEDVPLYSYLYFHIAQISLFLLQLDIICAPQICQRNSWSEFSSRRGRVMMSLLLIIWRMWNLIVA